MESPTIRQCGMLTSCENGRNASVPEKLRVAAWVCEVAGTGSVAEAASRRQPQVQPESRPCSASPQFQDATGG